MKDILICSMPALFVDRLPGAPAILKSAVEQAGFTAQTVDFSIAFFKNQCGGDLDLWHRLGSIFRAGEAYDTQALEAGNQWIEDSISYITNVDPKILGISVFTNFQHRSTVMLLKELRRRAPHLKIVLGGMGLTVSCASLSNFIIPVKKIDVIKSFHQFMSDHDWADYVVLREPLDELIRIMQQELGKPKEWDEVYASQGAIFKTPMPNYDDYDLSQYVFNDDVSLPITGSKGCVRACTFCDIPGQFGRFSFRTGEDIGQEIIALSKKYGVKVFEFTDSLVNGSFKAFRQWLTVLADYNDQQSPDNKIRWFGQYICRPQQQIPSDIYPLISRSGVSNLVIGVESGSDAVLAAMKKQMTVKDVFDELEQFKKHNIKCSILMLSGFYNETYERYIESLKFLVDCQPYFASGIITKIGVGPPLIVFNDTYLQQEADKLGLVLDTFDESMWTAVYDPTNDYPYRAVNRVTTQLVVDALGYPTAGQNISNIHQVLQKLRKKEQELTQTLYALTQVTTDRSRLSA